MYLIICHNIVLDIYYTIPAWDVKIPKIDTWLIWVPVMCVDNSDHPIFRNAYQKSNDFLQYICDFPSDFRAFGYG